MSDCWILPQPPQWFVPQYNFCRIFVANRCVLEAWGRDYTQCWITLPLTCTSTRKESNMDSSSVKLLVPLEWEEICSWLAEDQLQRAGEKAGFGWLKCSGGLSVLNTWITKGCRINEHYTPFSHPLCWTCSANLPLCYSCHHAEALAFIFINFTIDLFLHLLISSVVLYSSVLTWDRMRGWN